MTTLHEWLMSEFLKSEITIDYEPDQTKKQMQVAWHNAVIDAYNDTSTERVQLRQEFGKLPFECGMSRNVLTHVQRYTDLSRHVDSHPHVIKPLADSLWEHVSIVIFG